MCILALGTACHFIASLDLSGVFTKAHCLPCNSIYLLCHDTGGLGVACFAGVGSSVTPVRGKRDMTRGSWAFSVLGCEAGFWDGASFQGCMGNLFFFMIFFYDFVLFTPLCTLSFFRARGREEVAEPLLGGSKRPGLEQRSGRQRCHHDV